MEAPPEIGAALDRIFERAGFVFPLVDLAYSDPYAVLSERVIDGALE